MITKCICGKPMNNGTMRCDTCQADFDAAWNAWDRIEKDRAAIALTEIARWMHGEPVIEPVIELGNGQSSFEQEPKRGPVQRNWKPGRGRAT